MLFKTVGELIDTLSQYNRATPVVQEDEDGSHSKGISFNWYRVSTETPEERLGMIEFPFETVVSDEEYLASLDEEDLLEEEDEEEEE